MELKEGTIMKDLGEAKNSIKELEYEVLTLKAKCSEIDKLEETIWSSDYQEKVN